MKESVNIKQVFKVSAETLYHAWLDSHTHTEMTGGDAICSTDINAKYTAWDEYIWGENVELLENKKIVQTWRTVEFDENDEDSILTLEFNALGYDSCEFVLSHTNIPNGQTQYKEGWMDNYIEPMMDYFHQ